MNFSKKLLFLGFYIYHKKNSIFENYTDIETYDIYFLTNTINDNIIIIEGGSNGIIITSASKGKKAIGYSYLKMNLKQSSSDILDIQNANGQYWYFNYSSHWGALHTNLNSSCKNQRTGNTVDLSKFDKNQIFENAIFFKNGTMITFDITGTHMIIGKVPITNSISNVQSIFALTQYDKLNLNGNSMTVLYYNGKDINNFYYNGSCGINNYGTSKNNINFMDTLATLSPSNKKISVLQFSNGCFIDGSQPGFILRFIGEASVIQFDLSGNYDILQIWNIFLGNYFYYNTANKVGITQTRYSTYTLSQKNRNYWDMQKLNLLPYPIRALETPNTFSFIDQIVIYNNVSLSQPAILIQVDTCPYGQTQGNNLPQGSNNWSLTISSIFYDNNKKTIRINPNAVSKFSFNFNCGKGDLIDFIVNNGKSKNNTMYYYYNSGNITGNNKTSSSTPPPYIKGNYGNGGTDRSVFPNNVPFGTGDIVLPTKKYPYAFRGSSPNRLVFENTITFSDNTQMGIDKHGNCILKGSSTQVEFNIAKINQGNNLNIFSINSDGSFNPSYNNFMYNGTTEETPIASNQISGDIKPLQDVKNAKCYNDILENSFIQNSKDEHLDYQFLGSIPIKKNNEIGLYWSCDSIQNDLKNNYIIRFSNGYETPYGEELGKNTTVLLLFKLTPSELVSESPINIMNGKVLSKPIKKISFSNGISISGNLVIQGLYGSIFFNMGSTQKYMMEIVNRSIGGSSKNAILNYNDGKNELLRETFIPEGIIHWILGWGDCGITEKESTIIKDLDHSGNLVVGEKMSTDKNPKSTDTKTGWPCSSVTMLDPKRDNFVVQFANGYRDISGNTVPRNAVCVIEPIIGILHHILSWGNCGIKPTPSISMKETTGNFLVGQNMSTNSSSKSDSDDTGWSCTEVSRLDPVINKLIYNFPEGYKDILGNKLSKGSVCILEPIVGILHYIGSWGDCGINKNEVQPISIPEDSGNFLVGRNMSTSKESNSSDGTTGWPCLSVQHVNPISNNLIVTFPNGYIDYNGSSIVQGGVCVIEPINHTFLEILYGIKPIQSLPVSIDFNTEEVKIPGGSWKASAKNYSMTGTKLNAQLKNDNGIYKNTSVEVVPGATYSNENGQFKEDRMTGMPGGSWIDSAKNYSMTGRKLNAQLKNDNGIYKNASVEVVPGATYSSVNGKFEENLPLPGGSWKTSAKNYSMTGGKLNAQLKNDNGIYKNTSVEVIPGFLYSNENGKFKENLPLPGGSWKESAKNYEMKGRVLKAELKKSWLAWNNTSVKVTPGATYSNENGNFKKD
jgi:hypothetical protein